MFFSLFFFFSFLVEGAGFICTVTLHVTMAQFWVVISVSLTVS